MCCGVWVGRMVLLGCIGGALCAYRGSRMRIFLFYVTEIIKCNFNVVRHTTAAIRIHVRVFILTDVISVFYSMRNLYWGSSRGQENRYCMGGLPDPFYLLYQ